MTQQAQYDLLLQGGNLVDPAQGINGRRDVAFRGGRVAAVAERIDPVRAMEPCYEKSIPPRDRIEARDVP